MKQRVNKIGRRLGIGLIILLGTVSLLGYSLTFSPVQNWMVYKIKGVLEKDLGTEVHLSGVDAGLPTYAILEGLEIPDKNGEDFLKINAVKIDLLNFSLWEYLLNSEPVHKVSITDVQVFNPELRLVRSRVDSSYNIPIDLSIFSSTDTTKSKRPLRFVLQDISLHKAKFRHIDSLSQKVDSLVEGRINFNNLDLKDISTELAMTFNPGISLDARIDQLSFIESLSGFQLDSLQTRLSSIFPDTTKGIGAEVHFQDFLVKMDDSRLMGSISFPYSDLKQVFDTDITDDFELDLKESELDINSLYHFLPDTLPIKGRLGLKGKLVGNIERLNSDAFHVALSDSSSIYSSFILENALKKEEAHINILFRTARISAIDLKKTLPTVGLPAFLNKLRNTSINGKLVGNYFDFDLNATAKDTSAGTLVADLHIQLPPKAAQTKYSGKILTNKLNLNAMGFKDVLDSRNLNVDVLLDGSGTSTSTAQMKVKGFMIDSEIMGRKVDSIYTDISVEKDALIGKVYGEDEEGKLNLDLNIDQSKEIPVYAATGRIDGFNLKRYGLYEKDISISTEVNGSLLGNFPDDITGELNLKNTDLIENTEKQDLHIPDLWFRADRLPNKSKYYNLKSSVVDADITGTLNLNQGFSLVSTLAKETQLFFENNDSLSQAYYAEKEIDSTEVSGQFAMAPKEDLNKMLALLGIPAQPGTQGLMTGSFQFGEYEQVSMKMSLDSLRYKEFNLMGNQIDIELFKLARNEQLGIVGALLMDSLLLPQDGKLERISFNLDGLEKNYESTFIAVQEKYNNRVQLQMKTYFAKDGSIRSAVNPSNSLLVMRGDTLPVSQEDSIIYSYEERRLDIQNLMLSNGNTYIRAEGMLSPDPEDLLTLDMSKLDLKLFQDLYPAEYFPNGKLNASISLQNLLNDPFVESNVRIDSFGLDDFNYGDMFGSLSWKESENVFRVKSQLYENQKDTTLVLAGRYAADEKKSPLYLELQTNNPIPLEYAYPFVKRQLYGMKGSVELDSFKISGNLDNFKVNGIGHFKDAGFGVDYFKTEYTFNGEIAFDNDRIKFEEIRLFDKYQNHADFNGYIYHEGLQRFIFALQLDKISNFLVMDTDKGDNELFYGKVFVKDGVADITGSLDKLVVNAFASSGAGSNLKVPVTYDSEFGRPDYIRFKGDKEDDGKVNTGLKDVEINLTAYVSEESDVELIFDERVGDIMQGRGTGNLNMVINTDGDFKMYGNYEITEGNYLFTAQNVFNKKFEVKQGGRITWSGDPYEAELNLEAIYPLYADIREVINEENAVRVPVHVLMKMQGSLLEPNIALEIELPSMSNDDIPQVASYLKTITYDEQELNKQVFSLMVFNRFAPTGGFINGQDAAALGVTTSVSEMLSNQLNYWLSQAVDDKLSLNLGTTNFKDVNLLVSYKLFNDRVIIERDGNLVSQDSNLTIGNLSVIIKLLPRANNNLGTLNKGNELVLEVFNREGIDSELYNNTSQTGLGIFYKKDFDKLGNIFKSKKKR